jgi:lycopene beta-cyclase
LGSFTYLFLILIWSMPLIVLQWLVGGDILLRRWKVLLPGVLIPSVYLTLGASFALRSETWAINPTQSLNVFIPIIHVPIEELLLFLATNTFIVQGMILLWTPTIRQRMTALFQRLVRFARRGPEAVETEPQD